MLSGSFVAAEPVLIECLSLQGRTGGTPYGMAPRGRARDYGVDALRYAGDWFTNRSVHGHFLETVRPTRARLEIGARSPSALEVTSTFAGTLDDLFVIDDAGRFWRGSAVAAGRKAPLSPATASDFESWWKAGLADAGVRGQALLEPLSGLERHFYARAAGEGPIETSRAVRWRKDRLLLVGTATFGASIGS